LILLQSIADVTAISIAGLNERRSLENRLEDRIQELEETNRSLHAFTHSVSHDLRTPLQSLAGIVQMFHEILEDKLDEEDLQVTSTISNNINHMVEMVDGLLAFSKLGKQVVQTTDVSMNRVVREICETFEQQETGRTLEFIVNSLPDIKADAVLIKQVWVNLVGNAVKYTRKKKNARIEIGSEATDKYVVYYVKDNGAGFNMDYAHKLFGVFQRLHTDREFEGTGIGLSLAHRIINKHGGNIWAQAMVDKGATFYFSLPRC